MRRLIKSIAYLVLFVAAAIVAWSLWANHEDHEVEMTGPLAARIAMLDPTAGKDPVARGRYLALVGDCAGCHNARGAAREDDLSGGVAVPTVFGRIYTSNLTPDSATGIGQWSADDFWRALHEGRGRAGEFLYPAFPYPNYTRITRSDSDALYAYLMSLPAVQRANTPHALRFPYNVRPLLFFWRLLYFRPQVFETQGDDPTWNRGAYLASGLGHCVACHSPRNALGGIAREDELSGGLIAVQDWYAPSLTSDAAGGLGAWSVDEVAQFLKDGVTDRFVVFGPMAEVVHDSTQHLTDADLKAMAIYLKSLPAKVSDESPSVAVTETTRLDQFKRGELIYAEQCVGCHQADGKGVPRAYPALANNPGVIMTSTINAVRAVLNGGFPPGTAGNPRPFGMPPFAQKLSDDQIASVLTYARNSWGNRAPAVSSAEVARDRAVPVE